MADKNTFAFEASWGTRRTGDKTHFSLWAPSARGVELAIGDAAGKPSEFVPMQKDDRGWWSVESGKVPVGGGYGFRVDGERVVPDPAARAQLESVHSLSKLVDPTNYHWKTADWKGRPWHECVFYELHTGTFTPEGTFDGIIGKLDYLKDVGITAVELLPVAQFDGKRGWGYDGVYLYAPHEVYGGPEGLKRLVDAAHERGLMVFLDVVYNHFGPEGNYINSYTPEFFHEEIHTPWGAAIAYDEKPVRDFMIENALYWLEEYRIDGLRLDAIDSIKDTTDVPFVKELAQRVRERFSDRHVHLTTEDDRNITWHIERNDDGSVPLVSGEWNDDFHHTAHALSTHEQEGYYEDYFTKSAEQMAHSLATGFVFQGEHSEHRGRIVGTDSSNLPPTAFVNFLQNHDQIGNRAFGERLTVLAAQRHLEALQAILLLSPQIPLMFMGEEYGDTNPFCFFTDFHGELADLVREGRRSEFKKFAAFQGERTRNLIPDPNAESTFYASMIDWSMKDKPNHLRRLMQVRDLLKKRSEQMMPLIAHLKRGCGSYQMSESRKAFIVSWRLHDKKVLNLFANLSDDSWHVPAELLALDRNGDLLHAYPRDAAERLSKGVLPGPSVVFSIAPEAASGK